MHLLEGFYSRTLIPPAVVVELKRGREIGIDLPDAARLPWVKIQAPTGLGQAVVAAGLDAGETEVLALGLQVPGSVVIVDERLGRFYAEAFQLEFTGTLGVLLRAKAEGRIPRIGPLLDELNLLGFRLSARTRVAVLKQAGEG